MEHAVPFARYLAKLVALLVYERSAVDEQKLQLRAAGALLKDGPVTITVVKGVLQADGVVVSQVFSGVREFVVQLEGHRVRELVVASEAAAGDLLVVARALAEGFVRERGVGLFVAGQAPCPPTIQVHLDEPEPERLETISAAFVMDAPVSTAADALEIESAIHPGGDASVVVERLVELEPTHADAPADEASPHAPLVIASVHEMSALAQEQSLPAVPEVVAEVVEAVVPDVVPEVVAEVGPEVVPAVLPDVVTGAVPEAQPISAVGDSLPDAPPVAAPPVASRPPSFTPSAVQSTASDAVNLFRMLSGNRRPGESVPDLLQALGDTHDPAVVARVLDDLCTLCEVSLREGNGAEALAAFLGVIRQEATVDLADVKRAFIVAVRRLAKPAMLTAFTHLLTREPDQQPAIIEVLQRTGEEGATSVIEQYANARQITERDTHLTVLRTLTATPTAIMHLVTGPRVLLARTAAELAAQLVLVDAESALLNALGHDDVRVRRAVVLAIAAIGSPRTPEALVRALQDTAPEVRMQAGFALATLRPANVVALLGDALSHEQETEVQVALVQAIGRVGTTDAVDRLAQAAEPARGLFSRKPVQLRVAAVHALAALRVPGVSAALSGLSEDKERAVRDALAQASRIHGRRVTRSVPVVRE